jgi:hypothetical protein
MAYRKPAIKSVAGFFVSSFKIPCVAVALPLVLRFEIVVPRAISLSKQKQRSSNNGFEEKGVGISCWCKCSACQSRHMANMVKDAIGHN